MTLQTKRVRLGRLLRVKLAEQRTAIRDIEIEQRTSSGKLCMALCARWLSRAHGRYQRVALPQNPLHDEVVPPGADCHYFICRVADQLRRNADQHIGLHEPLILIGQLLLNLRRQHETLCRTLCRRR